MKTDTRYLCEKCGKEFGNDEKCLEHESAHVDLEQISIAAVRHERCHGDWPYEIVLATQGGAGRRATYEYVGEE